MPEITIRSLEGHPEWIETCAAWWHRQWGAGMGYSLEGARAAIEGLVAPGSGQAALVALVDNKPSGSVFLVERDLETHTHLAPWLAGLFVLPEYRRLGLGQKLTAATTEQAALLGYEAVYLYTAIGDFYRRQGWTTYDEIVLHDIAHEVMAYGLPPA